MNSTNNLDEDIPKYEKLVFLINIDNTHWLTIAVYLRDSVIAVYDSLSYDTEKFITQITARLKKLGKKWKQPN
jgi:Ulp1 family protease